jgi:hypothetical protein
MDLKLKKQNSIEAMITILHCYKHCTNVILGRNRQHESGVKLAKQDNQWLRT